MLELLHRKVSLGLRITRIDRFIKDRVPNTHRMKFIISGASRFRIGPSTLEELLRPLEYLDLGATYEHYSAIIDLFIYTLIFVGLAKVTLGWRFQGKGGTALSVGVGISLAVGFVIAEEQFGFSLRSFGVAAAGFLILILGIMMYLFIRQTGLHKLNAFGFSYLSMFLLVILVSPELFSHVTQQAPLFALFALFVLLVSMYLCISSLWSGLDTLPFDRSLRRIMADDPVRKRDRNLSERETRFIKRKALPEAKHVRKDGDKILGELGNISKSIEREGASPKGRQDIIQQMKDLVPKGQNLLKSVQNLKEMTRKLAKADLTLLADKARESSGTASGEEKAELEKEITHEQRRLVLEKRLDHMERLLQRELELTFQALLSAASEIERSDMNSALKQVQDAIAAESTFSKLAKQIRSTEKELLRLSSKDLRAENRLTTG